MKIAMGTPYPFDENVIHGGVEAVALSLANSLAKRNELELHIISCNESIKRNITEQRGSVTFHWLATGRRLYGLRAATVNAWQVRKIYEFISPDVIHAQGFSEYALAAPDNIPMVLTIHGLFLFIPAMLKTTHFRGAVGLYRRWIGGLICKTSVKKARAIISIAGDYIPRVMGGLLNGKSVFEIANPIDTDFWGTVSETHEYGDQILCVGTIVEHKNTIGLVRAFAEVTRQFPRAKLNLAGGIGEPDYFVQVQNEVEKYGLHDKVAFLGRLDQRQLRETYARSSIVVLASMQETTPMALAQAMAAGKPVVATRVGGISWMIEDGVTGYLVDEGDVRGMTERILDLLRDRTMRENMGRVAIDTAKRRFEANEVADQTVQAYRDLLSKKVVQ